MVVIEEIFSLVELAFLSDEHLFVPSKSPVIFPPSILTIALFVVIGFVCTSLVVSVTQ